MTIGQAGRKAAEGLRGGQLFFVCIESAYLPYPTDVIFATSVPSSSVTTAV